MNRAEPDEAVIKHYWNAGTALPEAVVAFSDHADRAHLSILNNGNQTPTPELLIQERERLLNRLRLGELVAVGKVGGRDGALTLQLLPLNVLHMRFVLWRDGVIRDGRKYENVHVCESTVDARTGSEARIKTIAEDIKPERKRGGGRKDTYPLCVPVLALLDGENPSYLDLSPERLLVIFAARYQKFHSRDDDELTPSSDAQTVAKLAPPPGAKTLGKHLERYKREKTGKNS